MDIGSRQLQFVIAAAQFKSIRRAAAFLRVRQSTLSRAIQHLEGRLDVSIFVRGNGGVRLTPAGMEFVKGAKRLVDDCERLVSAARGLEDGRAGSLILGLPNTSAAKNLGPVLIEFASGHPNVDIQLIAGPKFRLMADLESGAVDLAIVVGGVDQWPFDHLSLWSERILVIAPHSHFSTTRTFIFWADLLGEVLLVSRQGLGPELKATVTAKIGGLARFPKMQEHAIGGEALLSLVKAGRGLSLQCGGTVGQAQSGLVCLEVHDDAGPSWIGYSACWMRGQPTPAVGAFLALLKKHHSLRAPSGIPDT